MVLVLLVVVGAIVVALLAGGSWGAIAGLRLRARWLVGVAVLAQVFGGVLAWAAGAGWCYTAGLALSAAAALTFCLANLPLVGVPLVTLGLVANALVVALNGAMPVSIDAASRAGVSTLSIAVGDDPRHTIAGYGSHWRWLGDVIPVPLPVVPEVVSPGDVLVAAGLAEFVVVGMRRRLGADDDDQDAEEARQASQALSTVSRRS